MFKKILAILVMIFSILGAILCAAGILGAWVAQAPLRATINTTIDTANSYVGLAGTSVQDVNERVAGVRIEIEDTQQRLQSLTPAEREAMRKQLNDAATQRFGPSVTAARSTAQQVVASLVTLNQTLESVSRIPGVNVPTFTDELAAVNQRMDALNSRLQGYQSALSDAEFSGERLNAAATQVTTEIQDVESRLAEWRGQLSNISARLENAKSPIGNALTLSAVGLTLFLGLFLAGQISLFSHALGWFRKQ
jgi:chromosome segregation ATPase